MSIDYLRGAPITDERIYYTEYPLSVVRASSDAEALRKTRARVVYYESDTPSGFPLVMLREKRQ